MATDNQVALARQSRSASSHLSKAARQVVPAFLQKLYEMVNDPGNDELIKWSEAGDSFYVLDHERFAHEVLGRWFKHKNFSSFVRQLNMYGFHKIPHLQQGVLKSETDTELWNFEHPHFRRGQPDMLCLIQRKKQPPTGHVPVTEEPPIVPPRDIVNQNPPPILQNIPPGQLLDVNSLVNGIAAIKRHQQAISSDLNELKTSNQHLWQEAMASRERHKKHQDTINRILKFLASVFGHSAASPVRKHDDSETSHPVVPRKRQRLMIADSSSEKSRGASVADEVDEDDLMHEVHTESLPTPTTPYASIATPAPSELFSPSATEPTSPPTEDTVPPADPPFSTQSHALPSALTSFTPNRTASPNTTEMLQTAFNQMMSSPQQMQRLLQALSQSTFPIPQQPSPPNVPTTAEQEANNQLTAYAPPLNFDTLSHNDDINPNCTVLFPHHQSSKPPPTSLSSKVDDFTPLYQEQDAQLQKSWRDASHIAADVDLMDSNIKAFIDDLGFDSSVFTQNTDPTKNPADLVDSGGCGGGGGASSDRTRGGGGGHPGDVGTLDMSNASPSGDIEFDFEDLLTQFSRQNEDDNDYEDLNHQLASSAAIENAETDHLTALLDDVASDTASIRQHSPEAPLLGRKKRKSDVAGIADPSTTRGQKSQRSK